MNKLVRFLRLAGNNLLRGGQRVLVALLCIAFGVMALVAMTMLSQSIERTLVLQPAEILGGDLSMGRDASQGSDLILPEHVEQLKTLQQSGYLTRYTLIAYSSLLMLHTPGSGEMRFINTAMGVAPDEYPLAGHLTIGEPAGAGLPALLKQDGDVVITRDLAQEYNLKVGDPVVMADRSVGKPVKGTVRGIAYDTPNHQGSKIYYTVQSAQLLAGNKPVLNTVVANTANPEAVAGKLAELGWSVDWASVFAKSNEGLANLIMTLLRGAGILGLLVGGIGIANTMQVLLRRRQREIAIWKTLGYTERDLRLVFSLEAGLLGLAGSLIGAGLGVLISSGLLELFRRTSNLLYEWTFSPTPPLLGVLVGTLTTVIFAFWAIVVSSQAKPMALLRNEPIEVQRLSKFKSAGLALLLAVPFVALTSLEMKSLLAGIGVLIALVVGIAILGGIFSAILWFITRVLPLQGFPLARMALNSLRRRGMALVFAMIALFIGILAMSFGVEFIQASQNEMSSRTVHIEGYNLEILAEPGQAAAIQQALQAQQTEQTTVELRASVQSLRVPGGEAITNIDPVLMGRSNADDFQLNGAAWGSQPDGVYITRWSDLKPGSQVEVTLLDGSTRVFPVAGSYELKASGSSFFPAEGLMLPIDTLRQVAPPDALTYYARVSENRVGRAAQALGAALPDATVINLVAYAMRFIQAYQNLFVLAMAMAGLALLAGILLVANSVSLAMLDRRYEIGILKSVGYSRSQVLITFAVEYGLVGVIASVAGVGVVQVSFWLLALANHLAGSLLQMNLLAAALVLACGIGLTLLTVLGVTWNPTRVSPVAILSERN